VSLTVDEFFHAATELGLDVVASGHPGSWSANCPLCVVHSDHALSISCTTPVAGQSEGQQRAQIGCQSGCARGEVEKHLLARDRPAGLVVRVADLSLSRPPEWAWQDRIVLSALNLIVGQEGAGKGTLACWIFAKLTRGELPGNLHGHAASVAIVGDEDGFDAVWTPRLHAAQADLDRVHLIERGDGSLVELAADREKLSAIVDAAGVRLLYLDQLTDNLGAAVDDWRAKQVREALAPARQLARELGCAVLGSLHPNKSGATFRQIMSGSIAFNALSRSSLLLAEHPDDPDRRVVTRAKGNLSAAPDAIEFAIESRTFDANGYTFDVPRVANLSTSSLTTDDLINPATPAPVGEARGDAREIIAGWLEDGEWHVASEILADCDQKGVYQRAAYRAANDLGIEKAKRGKPVRAYWRLTSDQTTLSAVNGVNGVNSSCIDTPDTVDTAARVTSAVATGNGHTAAADDELARVEAKFGLAADRPCDCVEPMANDLGECAGCGRVFA
jgi:hypothetical protein